MPEQQQALSHLRVLDFSQNVAGGYCTNLLAGMGAEVIKLEPPSGDPTRREGPFYKDQIGQEQSGLFLYVNASKKSVTLNPATSDGARMVKELIRDADVLVETFNPGAMASWGLGYEALEAINPRLVMTSITYFGQDGPYRNYQGGDIVTYALGGLMYMSGDPEDRPLRLPAHVFQFLVGCNAFTGTMVALHHADMTGAGQQVDVSFIETAASCHQFTTVVYSHRGEVLKRAGNFSLPWPVLQCRDGYIGVNAVTQGIRWQTFCDFIGKPELMEDERFKDAGARNRNSAELVATMADWALDQSRDEVYHAGQAARLPLGAVKSIDEVLGYSQLEERGYFVEIDHPATGPVLYPGAPFRLGDLPWRSQRAPLLGEHNEEIYCQRLGFSRQDLSRLRDRGVI